MAHPCSYLSSENRHYPIPLRCRARTPRTSRIWTQSCLDTRSKHADLFSFFGRTGGAAAPCPFHDVFGENVPLWTRLPGGLRYGSPLVREGCNGGKRRRNGMYDPPPPPPVPGLDPRGLRPARLLGMGAVPRLFITIYKGCALEKQG